MLWPCMCIPRRHAERYRSRAPVGDLHEVTSLIPSPATAVRSVPLATVHLLSPGTPRLLMLSCSLPSFAPPLLPAQAARKPGGVHAHF